MFQFNVPPGKAGIAMGKCIESVCMSLQPLLEKHYSGEERLWPLDPQECQERCRDIWDEIYALRDQATFLISNIVDTNEEHSCIGDDPLSKVIRDAVMLELIDREVGQKMGGMVEVVLSFVWSDSPMLRQMPHRRARVYH